MGINIGDTMKLYKKLTKNVVSLVNKYANHKYCMFADTFEDYETDEIINFLCDTITGMEQRLGKEIKDLNKTLHRAVQDAIDTGIAGKGRYTTVRDYIHDAQEAL